ncbi:unnamed protein product [Paramecium sonneborni]|uniref:Cytochrome b5 heme-binding domain-containing protein n=1 Tax=Paramecium sonneborni TaxID=65129 RepID=A0A8S1KYG2_9CILI|nr:unnamed protein product [Paramecium sonneborni]
MIDNKPKIKIVKQNHQINSSAANPHNTYLDTKEAEYLKNYQNKTNDTFNLWDNILEWYIRTLGDELYKLAFINKDKYYRIKVFWPLDCEIFFQNNKQGIFKQNDNQKPQQLDNIRYYLNQFQNFEIEDYFDVIIFPLIDKKNFKLTLKVLVNPFTFLLDHSNQENLKQKKKYSEIEGLQLFYELEEYNPLRQNTEKEFSILSQLTNSILKKYVIRQEIIDSQNMIKLIEPEELRRRIAPIIKEETRIYENYHYQINFMNKHLQKFSSFQNFQKEQQSSNRLLYVYHNSVYDLTDFAHKHPGGKAALNIYKGRDLEKIFFNPSIHKHNANALQVLEQYKSGIIEIKQQSSIFNSKSTNFTVTQMPKLQSISNDTKTQPNKKTSAKSQSVKPKSYQNDDRLNQSMNNLNQSMTSSVKSHFLHIPNQMEIMQLQKQKQKQLIQTWKQTEIDELKRQQAEVLRLQKEKNSDNDDRKVQSEIISTQRKPLNPYYQAWLDKKNIKFNETNINNILPLSLTQNYKEDDQNTIQNDTQSYHQQKLTQSDIGQKQKKKINPYYEEWKRKQAQKQYQQLQQSIICEENESQLSGQPSSVNNSFQRSFSLISQKTIVQEDPKLYVPVFSPKFISPLKAKFYNPITNLNA